MTSLPSPDRVLEEELSILGYKGGTSLDDLMAACEAICRFASLVHLSQKDGPKWAARASSGANGYGETAREAAARLLRELLLKK